MKNKNFISKKRIIFVVGPYRSGTSLLTKGLSTMGVLIPSSSSTAFPPHNPTGDWEDPQFQNINNCMLNSLINREHRLRSILSISEEETQFLLDQGFLEIATILLSKKFLDSQVLGIKYPMASLLIPFWKRVFHEMNLEVSFVIALRNPLSVVASMRAFRAQLSEKSFWVWISFLLSCLEHSEGYQRVLVDYHQVLEDPRTEIRRIANALELQVHYDLLEEYSDHFADPMLLHFPPTFIGSNDNNFHPGELRSLSDDSFGKKFAIEIYQQLSAVSKDQLSFKNLDPFLQKWKEQFFSAQSLLRMVEHNEFIICKLQKG